jgi:spore maturation protein CgeB
MRVVMFVHSLRSCWNHGNAHFLRGVASELGARGHEVDIYEPAESWSLNELVKARGPAAGEAYRAVYPGLVSHRYTLDRLDLDQALQGADLVLVHEWNDARLFERLGRYRRSRPGPCLLFHDTHHRAVSDPDAIAALPLDDFDGVLAFGESLRQLYLHRGWGRRVFTWHEAADVRVFRPLEADKRGDLVWIGNWGDEERSAELERFLLGPIRALGLRARVHGVRYPRPARRALLLAGAEYAGWVANHEVPQVFARYRVTVHVPRRFYVEALPGIPTIRPFEALASGIPLVSAPWRDEEALFTPGEDFLVARNGVELERHLAAVLADPALAQALAENGRQTILSAHTCAHRVDELLRIYQALGAPAAEAEVRA